MGGFGSGRWLWHTRKTTVEECLILDLNRVFQITDLKEKRFAAGTLEWSRNGGEAFSRISYTINIFSEADAAMRLEYTRTQTKEAVDYKVKLITSKQNFGGVRWWFVCPLVVNNRVCSKRVGKLYLPSGAKYFGCRHCYDLTYTSSLESRQFDGLWKSLAADLPGLSPQDVKAIMRRKW